MSFTVNRRKALDRDLALKVRASHARSCAMLVAQKWKIRRSEVLRAVLQQTGVDLLAEANEQEVERAIALLIELRLHGVAARELER